MAYRWTEDDLNKLRVQRVVNTFVSTAKPAPPKRPKYGNRKTTDADGITHDSAKEFRRWQELELRARAGDIRSLRRQVPYALVFNGVLICRYIADFVYEDGAATVVEDVKSPATRKLEAYRLKARMMQAIHGIQIREV
jgi:hypothetical protein